MNENNNYTNDIIDNMENSIIGCESNLTTSFINSKSIQAKKILVKGILNLDDYRLKSYNVFCQNVAFIATFYGSRRLSGELPKVLVKNSLAYNNLLSTIQVVTQDVKHNALLKESKKRFKTINDDVKNIIKYVAIKAGIIEVDEPFNIAVSSNFKLILKHIDKMQIAQLRKVYSQYMEVLKEFDTQKVDILNINAAELKKLIVNLSTRSDIDLNKIEDVEREGVREEEEEQSKAI